MNKKDIRDFMKAFYDFMNHAEVEELYHRGRTEYDKMVKMDIESKAKELEVTCDYYIMEFM